MRFLFKRLAFAQLFGGAVVSQGLLSVINLLTGLILIRRVAQNQYGYYVLIVAAAPLLAQLQNQLVSPLLVRHITHSDDAQRKRFVGGLFREERYVIAIVAALSLAGACLVWAGDALPGRTAVILFAGVLAALATLYREFRSPDDDGFLSQAL